MRQVAPESIALLIIAGYSTILDRLATLATVTALAMKDTYDYVIVGAGAAGCVMAHRLSEDGTTSVLLVEGGGTDVDQQKIATTASWPSNIGTDTDWGDRAVPQRHLRNRVMPLPVGRIIGG